jgi:hypothetical protein
MTKELEYVAQYSCLDCTEFFVSCPRAQWISWAVLVDAGFLCNEVAQKENGCLD